MILEQLVLKAPREIKVIRAIKVMLLLMLILLRHNLKRYVDRKDQREILVRLVQLAPKGQKEMPLHTLTLLRHN